MLVVVKIRSLEAKLPSFRVTINFTKTNNVLFSENILIYVGIYKYEWTSTVSSFENIPRRHRPTFSGLL